MAWWYYVLGIGFIVLAIGVELVPYVLEMIDLRKERGLSGYDAKQFTEGAEGKADEESEKGGGGG